MGLEIDTLAAQADREQKAEPLFADRRLCLDATQTRLVEDGHVDARWQLAAPGHRIPSAEVKRLGLRMHNGRVIQGEAPTQEKSADEPRIEERKSEEAKERKPAEDKQRQPGDNKGGKK